MSQLDPLTESLQYGKHTQLGIIFGLILHDFLLICKKYCSLVPHYINSKITELGAEDLIMKILTSDAISEVIQYNFDM